nr:hypothetical protein GCM10020092_056410 [Actinoplanes digitatis]
MSRRYGVTDPAIAERYGYHVAPGDGIETGAKPYGNGGALSRSAILVLTGDPNGQPRPGAPRTGGNLRGRGHPGRRAAPARRRPSSAAAGSSAVPPPWPTGS